MHWARSLMLLLVLALPGCGSEAEPPENPPVLRDKLIDSVSFTIDGVDPREQEVNLVSGRAYPFAVNYTRHIDQGEDWSWIVFLLLSNDDSQKPAGILQERYLGFRNEEEHVSENVVTWKCQLFKNRPPELRPPKQSGRYEIRLCWWNEPTTVAEKIASHDDPESFQIPFYRAYINVVSED